MPRVRPHVLTLDLESTLVSNAVSQFARPGLYDFLAWALSSFERIVRDLARRGALAASRRTNEGGSRCEPRGWSQVTERWRGSCSS
jgi:hypothetical protein